MVLSFFLWFGRESQPALLCLGLVIGEGVRVAAAATAAATTAAGRLSGLLGGGRGLGRGLGLGLGRRRGSGGGGLRLGGLGLRLGGELGLGRLHLVGGNGLEELLQRGRDVCRGGRAVAVERDLGVVLVREGPGLALLGAVRAHSRGEAESQALDGRDGARLGGLRGLDEGLRQRGQALQEDRVGRGGALGLGCGRIVVRVHGSSHGAGLGLGLALGGRGLGGGAQGAHLAESGAELLGDRLDRGEGGGQGLERGRRGSHGRVG